MQNFGLSDADLSTTFDAGEFAGIGKNSLENIVAHLQKCYTTHVGVEISALNDQEKIDWLTNAVENTLLQPVPLAQKKRILQKLNEGVMFEKFLQTKYVGQKRFSLEGGETTIAALDAIINMACDNSVEEVVIGMAHRGRLNVLANIMGKTYQQIFSEFEGTATPDTTMGSGDVKYHLGFGSDVETANGKKIHLKLSPNPSHLEAVDPVVIGFARSKADVLYNSGRGGVSPQAAHWLSCRHRGGVQRRWVWFCRGGYHHHDDVDRWRGASRGARSFRWRWCRADDFRCDCSAPAARLQPDHERCAARIENRLGAARHRRVYFAHRRCGKRGCQSVFSGGA